MSQDSPATVAGTDGLPELIASLKAVPLDLASPDLGSQIGRVCHAAARALDYLTAPDHWAPVNRRSMRDDVDRFRNERMPVPAGLFDALEVVALALEYYEHATEVATRTSNALASLSLDTDTIRDQCVSAIMTPAAAELAGGVTNATAETRRVLEYTGGRYSKSVTGAKELADLAPYMVAHLEEKSRLAAKKAEAEKELGVARRRHASAITFAHAYTFGTPDAMSDPSGVAGAIGAARPDVTAGDTDGATLAETK